MHHTWHYKRLTVLYSYYVMQSIRAEITSMDKHGLYVLKGCVYIFRANLNRSSLPTYVEAVEQLHSLLALSVSLHPYTRVTVKWIVTQHSWLRYNKKWSRSWIITMVSRDDKWILAQPHPPLQISVMAAFHSIAKGRLLAVLIVLIFMQVQIMNGYNSYVDIYLARDS